MKLFKFLFYGLIGSLLLFGVVMNGYGQGGGNIDCEECRPANNQRENFVIQEAYLSNSDGDRLGVDDCVSGNEFWITLDYTSRQELYNVKLLFDLFIKNNDGLVVGSISIEYFLGTVLSTNPGEQGSVPILIKLDDNTFDCRNQVLELFDTRAFWTPNENLNTNGQCGGYAPGLCSNPPLVIIPVGVDGFVYDFDYVFECFEENDGTPDGTVDVTFFVTTLAGGIRPAEIDWIFQVGDDLITVPDGGFSYTINLKPGDVIKPDLEINSDESDVPFTIPSSITIPDLFDITEDNKTDNDPNLSPDPNGSITITEINPADDEYIFLWSDENGNILDPEDPKNLTGLAGGEYTLTMINQETGMCRTFKYLINVTPLPVLYEEYGVNFNHSSRSISFNWSTTKEWEASHFEIERAVSGTQFEKIGEVKAAGWSDQLTEYLFEDKILPLTGGNLLYRLKQVDFNGDFEYSKVLSVRVPEMQFTSGVWRAFPNPTDGSSLRISLLDAGNYNQEPLTFRLIHPTAQTEAISVPSEKEMNEMLTDLSIRMPKGVFVVEIQWGQKVEHIKVLKK
ncbi:hypothetical protein [Fontibacter flavus]|uniref:SprB repeat-containing protein n=1 Tax=Fontibacter flavus TaxID=654838 RepID=A0ABV6FQ02_9BACT